jgi:hypothetical protein
MKNRHRKNLSSPLTLFYKLIFPALITIGSSSVTVACIIGRGLAWESVGTAVLLFAFTFFLWWDGMRLKKVYIEKDELVISNYIKTIRLPLREMQDVRENRIININPVWLFLKNETVFGKKIMFMPPVRFTFFFTHPVVEDLRKMILFRVDEI